MYLKRLELCGFKSFADKTRLDFEPGITAIIGPNGCGKSNTSDAIRWCLGEQSARSMRSHQMMDVIFGGSQTRATTGMAEVALTFDNSQNVLPIDYSEVTCTRRLFRSGESEYFINKVQCRLKDIRDLFLDTGIGAEGYSIIEQGKVEFLLSARPEERREMFEEAAGVSKYKVRREETLRKLEKVEIDMNRISDMLALLKDQIASLDIAARKARQYQKIKDDLKRQETALLVQHIAFGLKEIERLKGELEPKTREFETKNTALSQTEADLAQIRLSQTEKDELYVRLQDEFSQIKSGISLGDERIQHAAQREAELNERQETLTFEISAGADKIRQNKDELTQMQSLWQRLSEEVQALENEYHAKESELQGLHTRITEYAQKHNDLKMQLFNIAGDKVKQHNEKNRLLSLHVHCQAQTAALQKELTRLQEQMTPVQQEIVLREKDLEALRQTAAETRTRKDGLCRQIEETEKQLAASRILLSTLREQAVSVESRKQMLQEWEQKDPIRTAMRSVTGAGIAGIRGPVSSLIQVHQGNEDIAASALGDKLNYMVCDTVEAAKAAIAHLSTGNLGRLTFLLLDRIPAVAAAAAPAEPAQQLFSKIHCAPELEKMLLFLCADCYVEGDSIHATALIQGGGRISFEKPVLIEEQLRALDQQLTSLQEKIAGTTDDGNRLLQQTAGMNESRKTLELECQKADVQIDWMEKQMTAGRETLQHLEKELAVNRDDMALRQREEQQILEQIESTNTAITRMDTDEQTLRDAQQTVEQDLQRFRDEENRLTPLLTESKVAWASKSSELSGREREEQQLKETLATLTQQSDQYCNELAGIEMKITELQQLQQAESVRLKELHQEQSQKEIEVQMSLAERQELMQALDSRNAGLHDMRQQVETLKQDIHNLQMEQRSFELQKQNMDTRLFEDYAIVYADVKDDYANVITNEEEIARLKRKIESMGAVNLAAPEEYASLEERYNFLLTQQQDLYKAKEDLHQVITKINHTTRDNFKKTYDLVRENFRNLYHQLFEGGEADLILTDENNLLESGVDILAQPPGKKLQNITLLSGGEKALTAIALLFAFFMVRPSPFCILDEVDAPLDDANIGRYINMIKVFAEKSQFIVITHNKRAMEMANVLYGVTMEELGVSKIISVRFSKDNEMAASA
jgi:chromosome segregation protein